MSRGLSWVRVLLLCALCAAPLIAAASFPVGEFVRTNGQYIPLPRDLHEARQSPAWTKVARATTPLGVEFAEGGAQPSPKRPLSVFYSAETGRVAALGLRMWLSNATDEYNAAHWTADPLLGEGVRLLTVTLGGAGLAVNAHAGDAVARVPVSAPALDGGEWFKGACQPNMSTHWARPEDGDEENLRGAHHGTSLLPVIPMYAESLGEGAPLTALAFWTAIGSPVSKRQGGIFDAAGAPSTAFCHGNMCYPEEDGLFGDNMAVLHVYFVSPASPLSQCPNNVRCDSD